MQEKLFYIVSVTAGTIFLLSALKGIYKILKGLFGTTPPRIAARLLDILLCNGVSLFSLPFFLG